MLIYVVHIVSLLGLDEIASVLVREAWPRRSMVEVLPPDMGAVATDRTVREGLKERGLRIPPHSGRLAHEAEAHRWYAWAREQALRAYPDLTPTSL